MKTKCFKPATSLLNILFILMILHLTGCAPKLKIVNSQRLYYDFNKKQLYEDSNYSIPIDSPLIRKENSKIQVEMKNYNPLNYDIVTEDISYDRFEPNVEYFNKLINYPNLKLDTSDEEQSTKIDGGKINTLPLVKPDCKKLEKFLTDISKLKSEFNKSINNYQIYISNVENILTYYNYLKSLNVITNDEVISGIRSIIIDPINKILKPDSLSSSNGLVFEKEFEEKEKAYNKDITDIQNELNKLKSGVDSLKKETLCKSFDDNKAKFYKDSKAISTAIDEFQVEREKIVLPNLKKVLLVYAKLQKLAHDELKMVTKSYYINKDIHTINIYKFYPETKLKQEHDAIMIQLTDGFRIDVSGGVFISGLYDKKYTTFKKELIFTSHELRNGVVRDTLKQANFTALYETDGSKCSYGGMAFLQGHTQNASNLNWGLYVGLGTLINDEARWAGSCGLSLIYGTSSRFSVNIGPIISQVDRLDSPYRTNYFYQKDFEKIPVSRVWKSNMMIGFSWKIGK